MPAGTPQGDRSVKEAVAAGLAALIAEHRKAVEEFGEDECDRTLRAGGEKIRQTRFKVEAYAEYLVEEKERLEAELAESAELLKKRIVESRGPTPLVFLADSEEAWGKGDTEEAAVAEMREQGDIRGQIAYKV